MLGTRYRLDSSWRRPAGGNVVVAGSPLRLFRLSTGGAQVAAMVEVGEAPDTAAVHQMLDRFVEAGALHPQHPTAPFRPAQVTIVVPAFGPLQASLVEQLARHPGPVVVVDDAGPAPFGNDAPTDRVQLVRHERNRGPAAARNTGLALVTTPLVAFLDTDVTPDGDWLLPLLTHFADERVALVAPRVMGAPGDTRLHEYEQRHSSLDLGDEALDYARRHGHTGLEQTTLLARRYIELITGEMGRFAVLSEYDALDHESRSVVGRRRDQFELALREMVARGGTDGSIRGVDPKLLHGRRQLDDPVVSPRWRTQWRGHRRGLLGSARRVAAFAGLTALSARPEFRGLTGFLLHG